MIVIGIDPHMKTHTAVALDSATGRGIGERTVKCTESGHDELLSWARALGPDRYFAIEDCGMSRAGSSDTCSHGVSAWCECRPR
ncbi:MAG: hypothetical protein RBS17_09530 [Coriobacteriia bacterium]|nr:hypothetical protein [Coriobacteriia bacterium]